MDSGSELLVIRVAEFIGEGEEEGGRRLNERILPALVAGQDVEMDFSGVDHVTEPFLEAALTGLLDRIPYDDLLHRLIVSNMTVRDLQGLRFVLERSRQEETGCCVTVDPDGGGLDNP